LKRSQQTVACARRKEKGYILLTLMLWVALMAILAIGVLIPIQFAIHRDQETEMIHRGVQYSRAIRAYYKKFGRYPTRLEDLESTNNLRFLRKRYKDPINKNKDFKLLHYGEPGVTLAGGLAGMTGGSIPGATPAGSPGGLNGSSSSSSFGGSSFGGSASGGSSFGGSAFGSSPGGLGSGSSGVNSSGVFAQSSGPGGNSNSGFGAGSSSQNPSGQQGTNTTSGTDSSQASPQGQGTGQGDDSSSGQLIASGPIVGVASISKDATIREFNHKKKYNEWQFVYDPTADRGGLITTPNQPPLQSFANPMGQNGQPGTPAGSAFAPVPGQGNNGNPGSSTSPVQTPSNSPQPQ
jgi:type II secretory pathway pseudopilin PulG